MKKRNKSTGKVPVLIQTVCLSLFSDIVVPEAFTNNNVSDIPQSGTGVLDDDAAGMYSSTKVYDDLNVEDIEALPLTQPHRLVDSTIIKADKEGIATSFQGSRLVKFV